MDHCKVSHGEVSVILKLFYGVKKQIHTVPLNWITDKNIFSSIVIGHCLSHCTITIDKNHRLVLLFGYYHFYVDQR